MIRRLALLLTLCSVTAAGAAPALKAGVFEPPYPAPEFAALKGTDGAALKLSSHRGKLVLLVFGFTNCPEVCPTTLATLAQTRQALGEQARAVQVVYVTVDPERDDLARIKTYLGAFDKSFIGGSGTPEALAAVRKSYGVFATKLALPAGSANGYGMNHSTPIYLIDREGRLRGLMPYGRDPKDFVHDIKLMLAAK